MRNFVGCLLLICWCGINPAIAAPDKNSKTQEPEKAAGKHSKVAEFFVIEKLSESTLNNKVEATVENPFIYEQLEIRLLDCVASEKDKGDHKAFVTILNHQRDTETVENIIFEGWISNRFPAASSTNDNLYSVRLRQCGRPPTTKDKKKD